MTSAPGDDEQTDTSDMKYEIFCAIATTACDAFGDVVERKPSTSAPGNSASRASASVSNSHPTSQANQSSKRRKTTLSMSSERPGGYATVIRNSVQEDTTSGEGTTEPLFLSNSQEAPASQMQGSQRVRMSQQEALELAGLGDMDEDDLMGAIEAGEEEDMQEEEEQERRGLLEAQGGAELNGTLDGISIIRRPPGVELEISGMDFEPDSDIFGGELDETVNQGQQSQHSQRGQVSQIAPGESGRSQHGSPVKADPAGAGDEEEYEEEAFGASQHVQDRSVSVDNLRPGLAHNSTNHSSKTKYG